MAQIHVLQQQGKDGEFMVVVHDTTPVGNNSAGISWANCITGSGRNISIMTEGTGAGQITTAELADITAGTKIEYSGIARLTSNGTSQAALTAEVIKLRDGQQAQLQRELAYYGKEIG